MTDSTLWWVLSGLAVGIELLTGTFYLLMLAAGMAAAAISAHLGAGIVAQMVVAAVVGGGAVFGWRWTHPVPADPEFAQADPNVNLDIGQVVEVEEWRPDGTATVHYRGAQWTAVHRPGTTAASGQHRVTELVGSKLMVEKI
jgi:membrane protein implicated in regulation of membrane protease activity